MKAGRKDSHILRLCRWAVIGVVAASLYGIVNDQITVSLSPEYFSVFKRQQFAELLGALGMLQSPARIQSIAVGVASTWWFGLALALLLSMAGINGKLPQISDVQYKQAVVFILVFALYSAVALGAVGYLIEPWVRPNSTNWPFLQDIREVRRAFAVGFWHSGAYCGGFFGALLGCMFIKGERQRKAQKQASQDFIASSVKPEPTSGKISGG